MIQTVKSIPLSPTEREETKTQNENYKISTQITVKTLIGYMWFMGFMIISSVVLWRFLRLHHQLKSSPEIERKNILILIRKLCSKMGIYRPVHVHYTDNGTIKSLAVSGVFTPSILLPRSIADAWSTEELEPILLHELTHIKRLDSVINRLQIILQAVYFFHPLVFFVNREIRRLREEVCDDVALHYLGNERKRYSRSIINVVKSITYEPAFGIKVPCLINRKKSLSERIERIMSGGYHQYTKITALSVLLLIFIAITSCIATCSKSPDDIINKSPSKGVRHTIAVLPFKDMSLEKDQQYFCDGVAENIIQVLHNEGFRVVSRTSSFYFKDRQKNACEIGKILKVETVLEGSLLKEDDKVRIIAQLTNVADESHLWWDAYDRKYDNVFTIQEEITQEVVEAVKSILLHESYVAD